MTPTISLQFSDPRLKELVLEQLAHTPLTIVSEGEEADYTLKQEELALPLRLGELLDRIRYKLSNRNWWSDGNSQSEDLGQFWFESGESRLVHKEKGDIIRLTDKERLLLRSLLQAAANKLPREKLLQDVWGYKEGTETHTLETHLYRLRQKLEPYAAQNIIQADGNGHYFLNFDQ